jgi:hypothetical protein
VTDQAARTTSPVRTPNRWAATTLLVLTPLLAELALGSTPIQYAWLVVLWLPMYGGGALLIRELVRLTGRGWPSILVLGIAYELVEDGIGLQALTSPTIYNAASWGPRVFGLNLTYWEANLSYHVIFTVVIPILLVDLIFPAHRRVPYLRIPGTVGIALLYLLGIAVIRVFVPLSADPTYTAPPAAPIAWAVLVVLLGVLALRVIPRSQPVEPVPGTVPGRWALAGLGFVGVSVVMFLQWPSFGAAGPAFTAGAWALVPMLVAVALLVAVGLLVRRWYSSTAWTDRHALWLAGGALVAHTTWGLVAIADQPLDRIGLAVILALTIGGLALLDRRVRAGTAG